MLYLQKFSIKEILAIRKWNNALKAIMKNRSLGKMYKICIHIITYS